MQTIENVSVTVLTNVLRELSNDISASDREQLRELYLARRGLSFSYDSLNRPQGPTISTCRRIGSAIKRKLGYGAPYGMSWIGFVDGSRWLMWPQVREAIEVLGWFPADSLMRPPGRSRSTLGNSLPRAKEQQCFYILSNPSMPGLLKLGKTTTHPHERMSKLRSTGVPTPFVLEFSCAVKDCSSAERLAHLALEANRISPDREFFKISVKAALKKILPVIGSYRILYPGKGDMDLLSGRDAVIASSLRRRKTAPHMLVEDPAEAFPTSKKESSGTADKPTPRKLASAKQRASTILSPSAAWPFPTGGKAKRR